MGQIWPASGKLVLVSVCGYTCVPVLDLKHTYTCVLDLKRLHTYTHVYTHVYVRLRSYTHTRISIFQWFSSKFIIFSKSPEHCDFYFKSVQNWAFPSSQLGDRSKIPLSRNLKIVLDNWEIVLFSRYLENHRSFLPIGRSYRNPGIWQI